MPIRRSLPWADDYHLGDEAILEANLQSLRRREPDAEFVATSRDPAWSGTRYSLRALSAPWFRGQALPPHHWDEDASPREREGWRLPAKVVEALRASDALIVSGGGKLCSTWPILERATLVHAACDLGRPAGGRAHPPPRAPSRGGDRNVHDSRATRSSAGVRAASPRDMRPGCARRA